MNGTDDMDYADFVDIGTELVEGLTPRLSEQQAAALVGETRYGIQEPDMFLSYLVATLADDPIPITPAEREAVLRLMIHRRMDLASARRFTVVDRGDGPESPDA